MFIDRITLKNFKSFKDAAIKLTPGTCSIIGPNGSGKSNITDALLFAFGDTHLRRMRARKTGDLIFVGANVAEATVEFDDNGKKKSITRKIRADGKLKYLMDGKRVNKYVIEEFLAKNSLSVNNFILQGEVQRIVEMAGKERRMLIDFIANVSEYEEKKKEAFAELGKVDVKIAESGIIFKEKEGQLRELKGEKENAEKWRDADVALRRVKATLASVQHAELDAEHSALLAKLNKADSEASRIASEIAALANRIDGRASEKAGLDREIAGRYGTSEGGIQREIDALNTAVENGKKAIAERKEQIARLEGREKEEKGNLNRAEDELKAAERALNELHDEAKSLEKLATEARRELDAFREREKSFSEGFQDARRRMTQTEEGMQKVKDALNALQGEVAGLDAAAKIKEDELERMRRGTPAEDYAARRAEKEREQKDFKKELGEKNRSHDSLTEEERKLNERLRAVEGGLLDARASMGEHEARLRAAGENAGAEARTAAKLKEEVKGVYGTLQELVSYDAKYSLPISVALGPRLGFVVVDSVKTAGKAVEYLKKAKAGRLSFIPLDKIDARKPNETEREAAKAPGAASFVIELLDYDPKITRAAEYACGGTLLMRDYASAEPLVRKTRMVTMGGELIEASGLVTGGHTRERLNVFAEQAAFEKWSKAAEGLNAERQSITARLEKIREELGESRREKARAELNLKAVGLELESVDKSEREWAERNADAKNAMKKLKQGIQDATEKAAKRDEDKRALIKRLSELNIEYLDCKQKVDVETESRMGNVVREKEFKHNNLSTELEAATAKLEVRGSKKSYAERALADARRRLDAVLAEMKECRAAINAADAEISRAKAELPEKLHKQKEFTNLFTEMIGKRERVEKELRRLSDDKGKLEFEKERVARGKQLEEVERARLEERLTEAKARVEEFKDVQPLEGKGKKDEAALLAERRKLDELISGLGTPNLAAIEKYGQRVKELEEQKARLAQLESEKAAVMAIIDEIEKKKKATFMKSFEHVNASFVNLFREIFPGKGSLYLESPDNPFEGGLTIQVQLENKEIKYLELMSGGEKSLIALLFLFALQSASPGSVYVLDEADAALDQENSRKLSLLLKELSKKSQFVVVTHNEIVYNNANCLVGVAMQGRQGSKIVEVNLAQMNAESKQ